MIVDFEIDTTQIEIEPKNNRTVCVRLRGVYLAEIIGALSENDILEEIGKDKCKAFFDLEESDE